VHAYVRDADDTIEWIEEKDLLLSSEDYGHDLATVQALIVKQEGFEVRICKQNVLCHIFSCYINQLLVSGPHCLSYSVSQLDRWIDR